jgi:hypothetical protein
MIMQFSRRCEFAIINKTYRNDFAWTELLFQSVERFVVPRVPFFIITPESDILDLICRFSLLFDEGKINTLPFFLSDEMVLNIAGEHVPPGFSGWQIQQVVKLAFSMLNLTDNYMTIDSAVIFTKEFNWKEKLFVDGRICTGAYPEDRISLRERIERFGECTTLNNSSVSLADALDYIDSVFCNSSNDTFWHVSSNGFFSSQSVRDLRTFTTLHNITGNGADNGFSGLINIVPCEFAWYGSYMANIESNYFIPVAPALMAACVNESEYQFYLSVNWGIPDHLYGILFHNQESFSASPEVIYDRILMPLLGF